MVGFVDRAEQLDSLVGVEAEQFHATQPLGEHRRLGRGDRPLRVEDEASGGSRAVGKEEHCYPEACGVGEECRPPSNRVAG